jgi:tetratricopeptide (TPR) repeat protein
LAAPFYFNETYLKMDNQNSNTPQEKEQRALSCFKGGKALFENKDYEAALDLFNQAIQIDDTFAEAYGYRAWTKHKLYKKLTQPEIYSLFADAYRCLSLKPDLALGFFALGTAKYNLKDYDGAIADYTKAIEIDANHAYAYNNRGVAKKNLKDYDGAIADYTKAIEIDVNYKEAYYALGIAKKNLKDYDGAIADYTKAIEIDVNYKEAYYARGIAKKNLKDYDGAIADYTKAIAIDANYAKAYNNRGIAKYNLKDYDGVIADYTKAIEINPNDAMAYNNRGAAKSNLKDYVGAIADYTKAIEIDVNYKSAYNNRGNVKGNLKDYDGAIADFTKALAIDANFALSKQGLKIAQKAALDALITTQKPNWQAFQNVLQANNITTLYHFTDRQNIAKIKTQGGLFSWHYLETNGITIPNTGGSDWSRKLDTQHGLEDFVRLSFCSDHPMQFRLKEDGYDLVVLKIKTEVVYLQNTCFSDMNATDASHTHGSNLSDLERVNFAATKMTYLTKEDPNFKFSQAEVMVKTWIPIEYITNIHHF